MSTESTIAESAEPRTEYKTPAAGISRRSDGEAAAAVVVFSAEALREYGIDVESADSVTATVSPGSVRLDAE